MPGLLRACLCLGLVSQLAACRCARTTGEVDDLKFARCAQAAAPSERRVSSSELELELKERVMSVRARDGLRVAAFTGPVGGTLSRADLALLANAKPGLVLYLGGLGDDVNAASANLSGLSALHVPTLFVAGGADRLETVEAAFASLPSEAAQLLVHGSGLRELRLGGDRFAIVPGSPLGRYAIDDGACGFTVDDLNDVREALQGQSEKGAKRTWLLSWGAPSGFGVSNALGHDIGSPELFALAQALRVDGGIFAYPETQVGLAASDKKRKGPALVVPRLGRAGATRDDGGRVPSSLLLLLLTPDGLIPTA
jgi:hypothetical protein